MSIMLAPSAPDDQNGHSQVVNTRHAARELGLQVLFQWDFHGRSSKDLEEFWRNQQGEAESKAFATQLVEGVQTHVQKLDRVIARYATGWAIDRMPIVDRNILRQSLFELFFLADIPAKVTLNEALQLAKRFADDETRRFVNGILDHVLRKESDLKQKRSDMGRQGVPLSDTPPSSEA